MFTGSYFHTMDNKGRISIPARYRETLKDLKDKQIVLTNWERYILAFPQSEWIVFAEELAKKPTLDRRFRELRRFLISGAEECSLDRQGRILVSQNLRNYAKLNREISLVGAIRCFEIWDRQTYESHRQHLEENLDEGMLAELLI